MKTDQERIAELEARVAELERCISVVGQSLMKQERLAADRHAEILTLNRELMALHGIEPSEKPALQ
jgi:uncharacterized coiled-coil protein SlyX